ncbi:MAG: hypothetical protein WBA52_09355 [Dolichospermum sp.]
MAVYVHIKAKNENQEYDLCNQANYLTNTISVLSQVGFIYE